MRLETRIVYSLSTAGTASARTARRAEPGAGRRAPARAKRGFGGEAPV